MDTTRQHRPLWQLVAVAAVSALAFVGVVAVNANADPGARQPRFGVSMNLSATTVAAGTPVTATGSVRDPQAVGREILFMAWNGRHFAAIARGVVASDRSYRLTAPIKNDSIVLVKLRKRYHVRRAGYSPRTVVHVTRALVSPPVPCTTTATETATVTVTETPTVSVYRRADAAPTCTPTATATATVTVTPTVTLPPCLVTIGTLEIPRARTASSCPWDE